MENSLTIKTEQIKVIQGSIDFPEYKNIKKQALQLAEDIKTVEVNDENLKQSKKLLAAVNKRCKELDDERIRIKKMMLEPYQDFEDQVKEIVNIVKDADATVRQQVKNLEEMERQEKKDALLDIFNQRKALYTLGDLIPFNDFLQPKHLNKTASIEKVEEEMVAFLERTEKDVKVLQKMPDLQAHVAAYLKSYDLADAMNQVQGENERRQQIEASKAAAKVKKEVQAFQFTIFSSKDKMLVEMFMKQNEIKFEMKEGM
jgi:hypothetical protein